MNYTYGERLINDVSHETRSNKINESPYNVTAITTVFKIAKLFIINNVINDNINNNLIILVIIIIVINLLIATQVESSTLVGCRT